MQLLHKRRITKTTTPAPKLLRARDAAHFEFARHALPRLIADGSLAHIGHGLYAQKAALEDPRYPYAELALRAPKAVVCLLSALHLHGLTDEGPHGLWIALPQGWHAPLTMSVPITVVHLSAHLHQVEVEPFDVLGTQVKVTSVTRTVVDCFRLRRRIGIVRAIEALKAALASRRTTIAQIDTLAAHMRISSVIRPYLEALQ